MFTNDPTINSIGEHHNQVTTNRNLTETPSGRSSHLLEYGYENQSSKYRQVEQNKNLAPRGNRTIEALKTIQTSSSQTGTINTMPRNYSIIDERSNRGTTAWGVKTMQNKLSIFIS